MGESDGLDAFFDGRPRARELFEAARSVIESIGPSRMRVTKSQVAFARRRQFARAWVPDRYLKGKTAPLVLSISLRRQDESSRWKEVVEPARGRWMHHLEVRNVDELDDEVSAWLREAYEEAG